MTLGPHRQFAHSLPMTLLRAREAVVLQFRPPLRRHGLNEPQWRALRVLAEHPEVTATQLAREAAILAPSLSRMLPLMERNGLIVRRAGDRDQRKLLVALTPAGRQLFEAVSAEVARIYIDMNECFGAERLARLHTELEALQQTLVRRRSDPPAA